MSLFLVVGLGNPGPTYAGNRHNVGQMVLDVVSEDMGAPFAAHKARAQVCDGRLGFDGGLPGPRVILAKPQTYMNVSGPVVARLAKFYSIPPEQTLHIHDELDLPPHTLRLKRGGGEGGHNGLKSTSAALGTKDYLRLRVGVGRPPGRMDAAAFVLRDFPPSERAEWAVTLVAAADAIGEVVRSGFAAAQERLHRPT